MFNSIPLFETIEKQNLVHLVHAAHTRSQDLACVGAASSFLFPIQQQAFMSSYLNEIRKSIYRLTDHLIYINLLCSLYVLE